MQPASSVTAAHTFGAIVRGRELTGMSVEEVIMRPGLRVPEHGHEGAQIYFLLEGCYAETVRGRRHELRPGAAWFRPPREPHCNEVLGPEPALTLIVTIEEDRFHGAARRAAAPRPLHSILLDEARGELLREMRSCDAAAAHALEGWALLLLSRTERALADVAIDAPEWLADATQYARRCYCQPLSLADVAAHVGVHPATLAAAFRRHYRTSVGDYIRELRLRHARAALVASKQPLKQIAVEAGFFDQAHFGRCFLRRFGVSPGAFRAGGGAAPKAVSGPVPLD